MYQFFDKNREKVKYYLISFLIIISILLVTVVYENEKKVGTKSTSISIQYSDFEPIKDFVLKKIKSPFINFNHEIKKGESIQSILKKYKIPNNEIQNVIIQYKKYSNPNKLLAGNKIDIVVEKNLTNEKNSISKIFMPISKSTAIQISKDEKNKIISKKIITKLYKKQVFVENVIKNNLYSSAVEAKINPETIIEFARIFGFEIDFQRDIRKNDYFKILYEKYYDENGEFVKNGSILYAHMSVNDREITLYIFGDDKSYSYFDINGKSVEKALMKTPINGARLSSPFGLRKHPILGFTKKHFGTDFAAPSGTPIMASGSGTIVWLNGVEAEVIV